jgi:hypothetical protein
MSFRAFADHRTAKAQVSGFFLAPHDVIAVPAAREPPIISTD